MAHNIRKYCSERGILIIPCDRFLAEDWFKLKIDGCHGDDGQFLLHLLFNEQSKYNNYKTNTSTYFKDKQKESFGKANFIGEDRLPVLFSYESKSEESKVTELDKGSDLGIAGGYRTIAVVRNTYRIEPQPNGSPGVDVEPEEEVGSSEDETMPSPTRKLVVGGLNEDTSFEEVVAEPDVKVFSQVLPSSESDTNQSAVRKRNTRSNSAVVAIQPEKFAVRVANTDTYVCRLCGFICEGGLGPMHEHTLSKHYKDVFPDSTARAESVDDTPAAVRRKPKPDPTFDPLRESRSSRKMRKMKKKLKVRKRLKRRLSTPEGSDVEDDVVRAKRGRSASAPVIAKFEMRGFACPLCGENFSSKDEVSQHIEADPNHGQLIVEKKGDCDLCYFKAPDDSIPELIVHYQEHSVAVGECSGCNGVYGLPALDSRLHLGSCPGQDAGQSELASDYYCYMNRVKDHSSEKWCPYYRCKPCGWSCGRKLQRMELHIKTRHRGLTHLVTDDATPSGSKRRASTPGDAARKRRVFYSSKIKVNTVFDRLLWCPLCGEVHPDKDSLFYHIAGHIDTPVTETENQSFQVLDKKCGICGYEQALDTPAFVHHFDDHVVEVVKCPKCEDYYSSSSFNASYHLRNCRDTEKALFNKDYFCLYRPDDTKEELGKILIYKCKICVGEFPDRIKLKRHLLKHRGVMGSVCQYCKRGFLDSYDLKRHVRNIHTEKKIVCEQCGEKFARTEALTVHVEEVHMNIKVRCDICSKLFVRRRLLRHRLTHFDIKDFFCDFCGKTFKTKSQLQQHLDIHSGERKYACDLCLAAYPQKSGVAQHYKHRHPEYPAVIVILDKNGGVIKKCPVKPRVNKPQL